MKGSTKKNMSTEMSTMFNEIWIDKEILQIYIYIYIYIYIERERERESGCLDIHGTHVTINYSSTYNGVSFF